MWHDKAELVQDHGVREELLIHIAKEATAVRDAGWRALKVVSDIDDTFLCSGGSFPSGTQVALAADAVSLLEPKTSRSGMTALAWSVPDTS